MFKLKLKGGVEVHTLEELLGNFDREKILDAFKSGALIAWLEDRFYDDEAEAIANIDRNDANATAKICAALDVEFTDRLREKTAALAEMTDDKNIIDNAAVTALNQEDLATLIQMDYKTIYLCGEQFNVPIRIAGVKYIGIWGTPKIKIHANSQDELDAKQISFENVQLPWQKAAPIDELKALAEKIFQTGGKFPIVKDGKQVSTDGKQVSTFDQLDKFEKLAALRMVCQGKYAEHQIAFMQLTDDLSSGFAFTTDAFCTGGGVGEKFIPYKEIKRTYLGNGHELWLELPNNTRICFNRGYNYTACQKLFSDKDYEKSARFIEIAKNV